MPPGALMNLVKHGFLIRKQGKGTFVTNKMSERRVMQLRSSLNDLIRLGLQAKQVDVIDISAITVLDAHAELLKINKGSQVVRIRRSQKDVEAPISYIIDYTLPEIGKRIKRNDLRKFPLLYVLKKILNIPVESAIESIEHIVADHEIAKALSVDLCSPIIFAETIIFEKEGRPIDLAQIFIRPDLFKYTVKLIYDDEASPGFEV
jgi:GntR family transcriptional regulator